MAGRRVVLGQQNDGTMGLRVSGVGVDAFVGDGQDGGFTFNSDWTDIAKIHQVGLAVFPVFNSSNPSLVVSWPSLGYKPFIEVRRYDGNVVRDDWFSAAQPTGNRYTLTTVNSFSAGNSTANQGIAVLYIVYAVPVPTQ